MSPSGATRVRPRRDVAARRSGRRTGPPVPDRAGHRGPRARTGLAAGDRRSDQAVLSSAFTRYVNSYLFLTIRFVAARMLGPAGYAVRAQNLGGPADGRGALNRDADEKRIFEINELPLLLPPPPPLDPYPNVDHTIAHWLDFQNANEDVLTACDSSTTTANRTPNGSRSRRGRRHRRTRVWMERGLRALAARTRRPLEREDYFRRVAKGLRAFVEQRASFYTGLETNSASSRGVCAAN